MKRAVNRAGVLTRLRADARGVAFLEFALIAPVLILFYFGTVEFCLALLAQRRAGHVAAAVGDLTAQSATLTQANMQDVFRISRTIMAPYATTSLRIRISHVSRNNAGVLTVDWGCVSGGWAKRSANDTAGLPVSILQNNQSMVFSETSYAYDSPLDMFFPSLTNFTATVPYRPRLSQTIPAPTGGTCQLS